MITSIFTAIFSNTGSVSFFLYAAFIFTVIVAMFFAFRLINQGFDIGKMERMIDIFKYSIVTVGITTVTLIISDLYKEREQQLRELEYFHKYTNDVTKADGLQARYDLTKYLSIVAPEGELKKSWNRYYDTLRIEYKVYVGLQKEKENLDLLKNPSKNQLIEKEKIKEKIRKKDAPLIKSNTSSRNVTMDSQVDNYRLLDVNGQQFGEGDFVETSYGRGGDIKNRICLIVKMSAEQDFIITIGRSDYHSSGISTNVRAGIIKDGSDYRKLNPKALKDLYPDIYNIIVKRAAFDGYTFKSMQF